MQTLDVISVNIWQIVISLLNLLLMFLILKHFLFKPVNKILDERKQNVEETYRQADEKLTEAARKEGLLALESRIAGIDEPFLARLMQLVIDSVEPNLINEVIETEIASTSQRHADIKDALDFLASITPAFGMIGTIIGLVNLLKDLSDPSTIGPNMSIALITTFYGTIVANLFIMPFAKKLEERAAAEDMYNEIIGRGVILIASGTNPRIVQEKLLSYMSQKSRTIFSELHLSEELSNA